MEPPDAGDLAVRADTRVPGRGQRSGKTVEVVDEQRGVRLTGGREWRLDAEVQHGGA
jgi:hypothetical protein